MTVNKKVFAVISALLLAMPCSAVPLVHASQQNCLQGVWNSFDFSTPAQDWSDAARSYGNGTGLVDLVVAQATEENLVLFPFPFETSGQFQSYSETDLVEPYLDKFDSDGLKVILSIQPLKSNVTQVIGILLSRYSNHDSIIGMNIDLEWKESGRANYASNEERDLWLNTIEHKRPDLNLFLTYYGDYTHFPEDTNGLVVLFDGERDAQANLLKRYQELANHYDSVGIYTGYSASTPPTASYERIMSVVPKTEYIIHTEDVFSQKPILIFEMDNVQVGYKEYTTMSVLDLHLQKAMPLVCGVIPDGLDNPQIGGGYLSAYLKDLQNNYFDIFEMAQLGYHDSDTEFLAGLSYGEQKTIMENGLRVMRSSGIEPVTFIPTSGSADDTTLEVAYELGYKNFEDLFENLTSSKLLILNSWISLTDSVDNSTVLKSPEQLMVEIDQRANEGVITILYNVEDFAPNTDTRLKKLSTIIDTLRNSKKYVFMTAEQYRIYSQTDLTPSKKPSQQPLLPEWALYLLVASLAVSIGTCVLVSKRRASRKKARINSSRNKESVRELERDVPKSSRIPRLDLFWVARAPRRLI